jgi:hypothetical protein
MKSHVAILTSAQNTSTRVARKRCEGGTARRVLERQEAQGLRQTQDGISCARVACALFKGSEEPLGVVEATHTSIARTTDARRRARGVVGSDGLEDPKLVAEL